MRPKATTDEIRKAIESLNENDLLRLKTFAKFRIRGLGRAARGRSWQDLLQEVFSRALSGARSWNPKKVDFFGFLKGAVRSVSDGWLQEMSAAKTEEPLLVSQMSSGDDNGAGQSQIDLAASNTPLPGKNLEADQSIETIRGLFATDTLILSIIDQMAEGKTGKEICNSLTLTAKEFSTATRRMRRTLNRMFPGGSSDV